MADAKAKQEAYQALVQRRELERQRKLEAEVQPFLTPGESIQGVAVCEFDDDIKKAPRKFVPRQRASCWVAPLLVLLLPAIVAEFMADLFVYRPLDLIFGRGGRSQAWCGDWDGMAGRLVIGVSAANKSRSWRQFSMAFTDHRIIVVGKGSSGSGKSGPPAFVAQYPIGALRVSGDGKLLADLRFADNSHVRIKSSSDMAQIHQQLGQLS